MFLVWVAVWKLADIASTAPLAATHGWGGEANLLIRLVGPYVGHTAVLVATVPIAVGVLAVIYDRLPVAAEAVALFLPIITVGNLLQVGGHLMVGSIMNVLGFVVLIGLYHVNDDEPLFINATDGTGNSDKSAETAGEAQ